MNAKDHSPSVRLSQSEAVVLFDFLSRFSNRDDLSIADEAERRVLWDMCCDLERQLAQPFDSAYNEVLAAARNEVREGPCSLPGFEGAVYLWVEQQSSIMLKAATAAHADPVELTADEARSLAAKLTAASDRLEKCD